MDTLISALLVDDNPDYPVTAAGVVRTLLYPCDLYELPEERMAALRDFALASGSMRYYIKLLRGSPLVYERTGTLSVDEVVPPPSEEDIPPFESHAEQHWDRRVDDLWWWGEWSTAASSMNHSQFLEHVLLDETGAWAVLFSPEDHGYLIAARSISRDILKSWDTTPRDEISRYERDLERDAGVEADEKRRILDYALAGAWT